MERILCGEEGYSERIGVVALEAWFQKKGWRPAQFQREVWRLMAQGKSGLVHSSTGSGKTLAVALGALGAPPAAGRGILWITPLRALAADLRDALAEALGEVASGWRVELWNSDVPCSRKRQMAQFFPEVLVTTPESLALLLSRADLAPKLAKFAVVVVDEWHELAQGKRGALLQLGLARLSGMNAGMLRWGLSATLANPAEAAAILGGFLTDARPRPMELVSGPSAAGPILEAVMPPEDVRLPWAGHLGLALAEAVACRVREKGPSLIFTNTRSQAELWHRAMAERFPEGKIGLHHSSLDDSLRAASEEGLRDGRLQAVVATSSLDLGIDFPPVRTVFQIGSPKGIARLVQRAGRSGHCPGGKSRLFLVPTNAFEIAEIAAARRALELGRIEPVNPPQGFLDVLCQHLLTVAAGGGFREEEMLEEVRSTHAYRDLRKPDWQWALQFITHGGRSLTAYPDFHRLEMVEGRRVLRSRPLVLRHRMGLGTIASDAELEIFARGQGRLGKVEESFVSRLRPGNHFQFAGKLWRLLRIRDLRVEVVAAKKGSSLVPQWMGGRMPLSTELAATLREVLELGTGVSPEMARLGEVLRIQASLSAIPRSGEILAETYRSREGFHLFFFPFEGRGVHEGLVALLAFRLRRKLGLAFSMAVSDYGIELLSPEPFPAQEYLSQNHSILDDGNLEADIFDCLNITELARRKFREIARIAGLAFEGFPGRKKSLRQLQISSSLLFEVFERYEPGHPLVAQAKKEALESVLSISRLAEVLARLREARWIWKEPKKFTPFAFPLYAERLRESVGAEDLLKKLDFYEQE